MPAQENMSVWRGNTFRRVFRVKNADGSAVNLTGQAMAFTVEVAGANVLTKRTDVGGSGFTLSNAAGGEATLILTPAETRALAVGSDAIFELERRYGGEEKTVLSGRLVVNGGANVDG